MNNKSLISIITVCYNSEKTIKDTIESVLNQTFTNIEYILVDGNSKDKTVEIIRSYEESFKEKGIIYRWISEPDKGIYDAMNKGIGLSNGELIGIINSDDWYEKDALENVIKIYQENISQECIIHGNMDKVDPNTKEKLFKSVRTNEYLEKRLNHGMPLNHPTVFVSKKIYETVGKFDISFKICGDYDFTYRCFKKGIKFIYSDKIISNMRLDGVSDTFKALKIRLKEHRRIRERYISKLDNEIIYFRTAFKYFSKGIIREIIKRLNLDIILKKYYKGKKI